ncbi:hypothetical protein M011DRAFT_439842 [Sporormia fimetaria CBS 119925]|uniref:N-acetyltransferase domain-containing protein n=1 Tax=Sporormia fimetaria CBS 119925 TaxID=1340428 RepID=A0A6A6VJT5_9PLEO|nr:hypothetical protein M011DRAFT_439842 [Sporormia fimetaria CBS 119925]
MSAYARVPRLPPQTLSPPPPSHPPAPSGQKNARKNSKWKPLDLSAEDSPQHNPIQQSESSWNPAAPAHAGESGPVNPPAFPNSHRRDQPSQRGQRRRYRGKRMGGVPLNQGDRPQEWNSYVPPHLRKRPTPPSATPPTTQQPSTSTIERADTTTTAANSPTTQQLSTFTTEREHSAPPSANPLKAQQPSTSQTDRALRDEDRVKSSSPLTNKTISGPSQPTENVHPSTVTSAAPPYAPKGPKRGPKTHGRRSNRQSPGVGTTLTPPETPPDHEEAPKRQTGTRRAKVPKGPPRRKAVWPKNRDMKPQSDDDGGYDQDWGQGWNQEGAQGWGASWGERKDDVASDSQGDADYDARKLVDWNGQLMPAPDWQDRGEFKPRHFHSDLDRWNHGVIDLREGDLAVHFDLALTGGAGADVADKVEPAWISYGDIVPHWWLPDRIEGESPQQFWRSNLSSSPGPVDANDLVDSSPWWETYVSKDGLVYVGTMQVPDAFLDRGDPENHESGVISTSALRVSRERKRKQLRAEQIEKKRSTAYAPIHPPPPEAETLKPAANIFLRPATDGDIHAITEIYNLYVRNSVAAKEFGDKTPQQMANHLRSLMNGGLPWIVAVSKGKIRGSTTMSQPVVGFAFIDEYSDRSTMYQYTFELEMFVHPDHRHQGVGKCLMDRMLTLVDPSYTPQGGYDWLLYDDYLSNGCGRVAKVVIFSYSTANDKPGLGELNQVITFLKSFGFRRVGHLVGVGYKHNKSVDLALYQRTTSEPIEAGP